MSFLTLLWQDAHLPFFLFSDGQCVLSRPVPPTLYYALFMRLRRPRRCFSPTGSQTLRLPSQAAVSPFLIPRHELSIGMGLSFLQHRNCRIAHLLPIMQRSQCC